MIESADGTSLYVRKWSPSSAGQRMGCALIVHGLGEHGGRYAHVAAALNDLGIEVWAHDHRGFGKSQGKRGVIASRTSLLEDTKLVFDKIRADADASGSQSKAILIGHSMGGAIVARAVTGGWITPRALVLSSPGLKSFINPIMRGTVKVMEYATPDLAVPHGLPLDKISHDAAVLAEAKNDPLNHRLISPRLTNFILEAGEAAVRDAEKLPVPALVQAAGDDKLVDVNGARAFAAAAPSGLCTLKIYEGLWHEIYNEREPDRAAVLADLKNWLSRVVLR